jgi:hypothetical protein
MARTLSAAASQTNGVTYAAVIRIPAKGIADFLAYEDAVLPLLPEFEGSLERRLRNPDGTVEIHILSFASDENRQDYLGDPRRAAQRWLWERSSAKSESLAMADVP